MVLSGVGFPENCCDSASETVELALVSSSTDFGATVTGSVVTLEISLMARFQEVHVADTLGLASVGSRCRGLVTLHCSRAACYRLSRDDPCGLGGQTVDICSALSGQSVEIKLSVWAHVFFSCEGRMKVVKTFVRESVMLLMLSHVKGVSCFWKRRKATLRAGGTER